MTSDVDAPQNPVESRLFELRSSDIPYYPTLFVVDIFIILYSTFGVAAVFRDAEV